MQKELSQSVKIRLFIPEIKQMTDRNFECIADIEQNIKRNGTIRIFNPVHMCAADINSFRKLHLRKPLPFPVIRNIQPQKLVFCLMLSIQFDSPLLL